MSLSSQQTLPDRVCFVTIGATAGFDALIKATLSAPFLEALQELDYTELRLQYGKDGHSILLEHQERIFNQNEPGDLKISGFDFKKRGLHSELKAAIGESDGVKGVVISHAGSGSILDALRIGVPLIVVPNPTLLDNHQEELAEELARQGYVVHGKLDDLATALRHTENSQKTQQPWPPQNHAEDPTGKGLIGIMDDELGFVD